VLVESFEVEALRHVHELDPERPVGLLVHVLHDDPVAVCAELGAVAYNPDHRLLRERPEVVQELHAAGVAVVAYTADDPRDWAFLTDLGVDGIVTNTPGELLAWQQALVC
jgi:glycerophosphoryl diester phosphodiesterase